VKIPIYAGVLCCLLGASLACAGEAADGKDAPLPPDLGTRQAGDDWPVFLGPQGDSRSRERGLRTDWNAHPPAIVWQMPVDTGYAMPSISRGRLFQFSRVGNVARLQCLTSETGKPLWKFEYPTDYEDLYGYDNGPRCEPLVDGPRVYILGPEGMLHCLRTVDGHVLWKLDTSAKFHVVQNFFGVGSTPVVFDDLLIANIGGSPATDQAVPPGRLDQAHGDGKGVVAFDKFTGEVRYALSDELASYASPRLATISGRPWCFVFARGGLLGFDPANGKLDFHFPWRAPNLESVNASTPVVVDDRVFISETYGPGSALVKVRPGGYDVVWSDADRRRDKRMQAHWNTPVFEAGYLYGSSGRHTQNAELRCIELASGNVKWSEPRLSRSSLLYVDGHLICLTEYGELLLVRATPEKFDVVGQLVLKDAGGKADDDRLLKYPAWAAPILSHGLLYVRGHHRLVCLEAIPAK
jgi:outer membrane protein assembly factor BamB